MLTIKNPIIVTHIITRFTRGGADENTLLSCNHQIKQGMRVQLIIGREFSKDMLSQLNSEIDLYVIKSLTRNISPLLDILAVFYISKILRKIKPDIVHTHTSKAGILGRAAAKFATKAKIVHGIHILPFLNVGFFQKILYLFLERLLARYTDFFVSVSHGMKDSALENKVGDETKHIVIPSGMNVDKYTKAIPYTIEEIKSKYPSLFLTANSKTRFIVMVAALEPRKRIFEFLDVLKTILSIENNVMLIILGEGPDRNRLEEKIDALKIRTHVALLGFRDDAENWIAMADVCTLFSEREGLPRVVVQYALQGKPIVVTRLPGVESIVQHGETGYIVDFNEINATAKYICEIISNKNISKRMSKNLLSMDLSSWSADNMAESLRTVYQDVLGISQ